MKTLLLIILLFCISEQVFSKEHYRSRIRKNKEAQMELIYEHCTPKAKMKINPSFKHRMMSPKTPLFYQISKNFKFDRHGKRGRR